LQGALSSSGAGASLVSAIAEAGSSALSSGVGTMAMDAARSLFKRKAFSGHGGAKRKAIERREEAQDDGEGDAPVEGEEPAATGEGQMGQGTALACPLPGIRLPKFDGEYTIHHRVCIKFPIGQKYKFQNGDETHWHGYASPGFIAIPFKNTAMYLNGIQAMELKELYTHYRIDSAAMRLSNFQCHSASVSGQGQPAWQMNASGLQWYSMKADSVNLGLNYIISEESTPHGWVAFKENLTAPLPPLLQQSRNMLQAGAGFEKIDKWNLWTLRRLIAHYPIDSLEDQPADASGAQAIFGDLNLMEMCDFQMGSPVHFQHAIVNSNPRDWRSLRTGVPQGHTPWGSDRTDHSNGNYGRENMPGSIAPNTYPNRDASYLYNNFDTNHNLGNRGPPTWVGLFEDICPKNAMPGSFFSNVESVYNESKLTGGGNSVSSNVWHYGGQQTPFQAPFTGKGATYNTQGVQRILEDLWIMRAEAPSLPDGNDTVMVASCMVETEINLRVKNAWHTDPIMNGILYQQPFHTMEEIIYSTGSENSNTAEGRDVQALSAADIRRLFRGPQLTYSEGKTAEHPSVIGCDNAEFAAMVPMPINNHLPIHRDPYFSRAQGALQVYSSDVLGTGDELWNVRPRKGGEFWNCKADPNCQLPWKKGDFSTRVETDEAAAERILGLAAKKKKEHKSKKDTATGSTTD